MRKGKTKAVPGAKLAFRGRIFDVYQWKQKMFDGTYETFERVRRTGTVQMIPVIGDKILIGEELQPDMKSPRIDLLGGRIEEGESPLRAAKRELLEETGLASENWELLEAYASGSMKLDWKIYVFVARNCVKVSEPHLDAGEKINIRKINLDSFIDFLAKKHRTIYSDVLEMRYDKRKRAEFSKKLFR